MPDRLRHNVLGILIDQVDYASAVDRIIEAAREQRPFAVTALAVHGVMTGVLDPVHKFRLNRFDLVTPDGQPVRWAMNRLHGAKLRDRVYGPTLTLRVCAAAADAGLPVYFYGSTASTVDKFVARLTDRYPTLRVAGKEPSKFRRLTSEEKADTISRIKQSGARVLVLGLGCPRQEVWAYEYRDELSIPILAVGAAFDFHAGLLPQAPPLLQRFGLEWAFRLVQEPRRLWRRYVLLNPLYLWLVALQLTRLKKFEATDATPPGSELMFG